MRQTKGQKKPKRVKYKIDVYGIELHVLTNYTDELLDKQYIRLDGSPLKSDALAGESKGTVWGILKDSKTGKRVIFVHIYPSRNDDKYDLINTIGHESLHAACTILDYSGVILDRNSEEAFAYLCGYITECVYKTVFGK